MTAVLDDPLGTFVYGIVVFVLLIVLIVLLAIALFAPSPPCSSHAWDPLPPNVSLQEHVPAHITVSPVRGGTRGWVLPRLVAAVS